MTSGFPEGIPATYGRKRKDIITPTKSTSAQNVKISVVQAKLPNKRLSPPRKNIEMKNSELYDRKNLSELLRRSFEYDWNHRFRAMEALRALSPNRRRGKKETLTYNDLFHYTSHQLSKLRVSDKLILIPEVVEFILREKKSYEDEWSGLLFVESVIRNKELRDACNREQKLAIRQFLSYLINWRLKMHGCEIFRDKFEAALNEWGPCSS
jgi:hypothetical protein